MKPEVKAFCEIYLATFNASEAYSRTHPKARKNTCWANGSRLLRNAEVKAYINARLKEQTMEADEVLARLAMQARGDLSPFFVIQNGDVYLDIANPQAQEVMYLVKSVKLTNKVLRTTIDDTTKKGGSRSKEELIQQWVQVELHDSQAALKLIGQHLKLFTEVHEVNNNLNIENYEEMMSKVWDHGD